MYIIYHYCLLQVVAIIIGLLIVAIFIIGRYIEGGCTHIIMW